MSQRWGKPLRSQLAGFVLFVILAGCSHEVPSAPLVHDGPIVLITFEGLRADMVGGLGGEAGWTPHLDQLIERADFSGRAVASSSWAVPALASLATGLRPWQHQALTPRSANLAPVLVTLAEALSGQGYATAAFGEGRWFNHEHGHQQGFETFQALRSGRLAVRLLRSLDGSRSFVWIQMPEPRVPFGKPPDQLGLAELAPVFDPEVPLSEELAAKLNANYRAEVARADARLGRLLRALEQSGQRERTLLAVVSAYGQHLGEEGRVLDGGTLSREMLEVPMVIDLPVSLEGRSLPASERRVSTRRLWATLVEAAGGTALPAVAPSLFVIDAEEGILSELYAAGGSNRLSWIEGDMQLRFTTWFAGVGADFYRGRPYQLDPRPGVGAASPRAFGRHFRAFLASLPLGDPQIPAEIRLQRWTAEGVEEVDDPRLAESMRERLLEGWKRFVDRQRTAASEAEIRAKAEAEEPVEK